jgi:protein-tyrosine phosphatase
MRVLMVCLGNICRSPLAEGILRHKAEQNGLDWEIDSAGTGGWHVGDPPDTRSIKVARKYGIDISGQRGRQFHPSDFDRFDQIFVMDTENLRDVLRLAPSEQHRQKVGLMMDQVYPDQMKNVPDPYYNDDAFEPVFHMLEEACDAFVAKYIE